MTIRTISKSVHVGSISNISGGTIIIASGDVHYYKPSPVPEPERAGTNTPEIVAYLETALAEVEEQLRRRYASTSTTDLQTSQGVNFAQRFRAVRHAGDEDGEVFSTLSVPLARFKRRLVVLGGPGGGKTTALLRFARQALLTRLSDPQAALPMFLTIAFWSADTPLDAWIERHTGLPRSIRHERRLLILDGLDELGAGDVVDPHNPQSRRDPRATFLQLVNRELSDTSVVISARSNEYFQITSEVRWPEVIEIQPLSDAQVRAFLELRSAQALWAVIEADEGLLAMAHTPLLLSLLVVAFAPRQGEPVPNFQGINRLQVFDRYIASRFRHEVDRLAPGQTLMFSESETRAALGTLAAAMSLKPLLPDLLLVFEAEQLLSLSRPATDFVKFAHRMHFIELYGDTVFVFIHRAFREFCAVPTLLQQLEDTGFFLASLWTTVSGSKERVMSAIAALGDVGDIRAVQRLCAMLDDADPDVAAAAAEALGAIGEPHAVDALMRAVENRRFAMRGHALRWMAIDALGKIGSPGARKAVPMLINHLRAREDVERYLTIQALQGIGGAQAEAALAGCLRDSAPLARGLAGLALIQMRSLAHMPHVLHLLLDDTPIDRSSGEGRIDVSDRLASELVDAGEWVVPVLHAGYQAAANPVLRLRIAAVAAGVGPLAVSLLIAMLQDPEPSVRRAALAGLLEHGAPGAAVPLMAFLRQSTSDEERGEAIMVLGKTGEPGVIPYLLNLAKREPDMRPQVAIAIASLGDNRGMPLLKSMLADDDTWIRQAAVHGLGGLADPAALSTVRRLLGDQDPFIRAKAAQVLANARVMDAMPEIVAMLSDLSYARVDQDSEDETTVGDIVGAALIEMGKPALPALRAVWHDNDALVRMRAVLVVSQIGGYEVVPWLVQVLERDTEDPLVRKMAMAGLLGNADERAVDVAINLLYDPDVQMRVGGLHLLNELKPPRAVYNLIGMLNDRAVYESDDGPVRLCDAAAEVLGEIGGPEAEAALANWRG